MRRFPIKLALLFVVSAAVAPLAHAANGWAVFTVPAKTPKTQVQCLTCTGTYKNLPSVGYQGALASFTGRFLDSTYVGDWQPPIRTLRAWQMKYDPVHDRIYFRLGSLFAAYDAQSFMSRLLSGQRLLDADGSNRLPGATLEKYLNWDRFFYPETESSWNTGRPDGQDYMPDFDVDDRGYAYLACRVLWGIVKDDYGKGGSMMTPIVQAPDTGISPGSIVSVKTLDGRYFVLVGSGNVSADIFDVSTPATPTKVGTSSRGIPASGFAKTADQRWIALVNGGTNNLEIFTPEALVTNGSPTITFTAAVGGAYRGITTDGTNFYAAQAVGSSTTISVITYTGSTWTELKIPTGVTFSPYRMHYGAGYLSVTGVSGSAEDIHVFRVSNGTLSDLDFSAYQGFAGAAPRYFPSFYSKAAVPSGYLSPEYINIFDSLVYKYNGKTYLIANMKGLGDVYEIKGADSVTATNKGVSGTINLNSQQPAGGGPYYGDKIVFSSATSASAPFNVNWNFGNSEAADNTATSTTGSDVIHQYSNISLGGIGGARTVSVTNANDSAITDSLLLSLAQPAVRVGVKNTPFLFTAPNASSPVPIVTSDRFVDASDGMVEGHYASWNIDNVVTKTLPTGEVSVGNCGSHTLNFAGLYGPYTGSGATLQTQGVDYSVQLGAVTYTARPFAAVITGPVSIGTNDVFTSASRQTTDGALVNGAGTTYTYQWELLDSGGSVIFSTPSGTATLATIPTFSVPKTTFTGKADTKARLTLSTALANLGTGCSGFASHQAITAKLNAPDPKINITSGCLYSGLGCTMTVTSPSGQDLSTWQIDWIVSGPSTVPIGSGTTFSPSFSTAGNYTVSVTATNAIGSGSDSKPAPITVPPCNGQPSDRNVSIGYFGATSNCYNTPCKAGEVINFKVYSFGYIFNATCDTYAWDFGDGTSSTALQPSHTYSGAGPFSGSFKITNGSNWASFPFSISFGSVGCQVNCNPQPTCGVLQASNFFITYTAPSGCDVYHAQACNTGETLAFVLNPYNGYNINCAPHTFSWNFGDNQSGSGVTTTHAYSAPGNYNAHVLVSVNGQSVDIVQPVTVGGGGNPTCQAPTTSNVFTTLTGPSGCTQSNGANCLSSDNIHFDVQGISGYNFSACDHTFAWNFGDGGTANTKSPYHQYSSAQTNYVASVTVTNSQGNTTLTQNVHIAPAVGQCPAPTTTNMFVTYGGASGCSQVAGKACSSTDLINFNVDFYLYNPTCGDHSYSWNFDDGSAPVKTKVVQHSFAPRDSAYDVTCTVNNGTGQVILHTPVTVSGDPGGTVVPKVDFTYEAVNGVVNLMKFTPSADPAGKVTNWAWNFGDGTPAQISTGTSPTAQFHQYAQPGTYTVTLATSGSGTYPPVVKQIVVGTVKKRGARH